MNLKEYIKFYVDDENHWYISKVKQISSRSINEMAKGLSLIMELLKSEPRKRIIDEYEKFVPDRTQIEIELFEEEIHQIKIDHVSKLFLSLKILSNGLIDPMQMSTRDPEKHRLFNEMVKKFNQGKNYNFFVKKYHNDLLTREVEIYFRNFESWLSKFGMMGRINESKYCFFTDVGLEFANNIYDEEVTSAIFLNQIKKLQVWNPTMDEKYNEIQVVPYFLILEILLKVEGNKFDKREYALFITKLKSHQKEEVQACIKLIHEFRNLSDAEKDAYISKIIKLDEKNYPRRSRTNYDRILDSSAKEIGAYTFGGLTYMDTIDHNVKLVDETIVLDEVERFKKSPMYIDFRKKDDWIRHLGSLEGLALEDIVELYVNEGKTLHEVLESLVTVSDETIEQKIKDKIFEKEIEDYYEKNLNKIDPNLEIVKNPHGRQYATPVGPIDILCRHVTTKEYFVIEFKRSQVSDDTIGQILRYMGWIYLGIEKAKKPVKGIIVGNEFPDKLRYAMQGIQSDHIYKLIELYKHPFTEKNKPPK
jgi:hypothetical protein